MQMQSRLGVLTTLSIGLCSLLFSTSSLAESTKLANSPPTGLSLGWGLGNGDVGSKACLNGSNCSANGPIPVGSIHFRATNGGPVVVGARYVGDLKDGHNGAEIAFLLGFHPEGSSFSFLLGPGQIRNGYKGAEKKTSSLSWEVLLSPAGSRLQYVLHGAKGDISYTAVSLAFVLGSR